MDLSQPQQQHAASRLAVSRPAISSSPSSSAPSRKRVFKSFVTSSLAILALMSLNGPTVSAQAAGATVDLTLYNEASEAIGQPQSIPKITCTGINIAEGTSFASASTSDQRSALNLYQDRFCQIVIASTTGKWANSGASANITYIRWEGTAPATATTGEVTTSGWPPNMAIQTQVAGPGQWVMDPNKGIIVVGLVAAVMVIGVLIGIYKVYKAAQFVPPPKKEKKPTGLNTKKIKKKDAYFKKPVRDDQQSFQRLHNESPEPFATRHQPMTERSRDSQYSEAATTFVDWNNSNNNTHSNQNQRSNNNGRGGQYNSDAISIDMRDTSHQARSSPSFHNGSSTLDLINFDQDNSSHRGHNGYNDRGRGGEVLVPMHTFDSSSSNYQQHQGRRRASSSRSR